MISKIDIDVCFNYLLIFEKVKVGTYRGEDSGAIYPEYQEQITICYDLNPIKGHTVKDKTIAELLSSLKEDRLAQSESIYSLYFALDNSTPEQVSEIYYYVMSLSNKDDLIVRF